MKTRTLVSLLLLSLFLPMTAAAQNNQLFPGAGKALEKHKERKAEAAKRAAEQLAAEQAAAELAAAEAAASEIAEPAKADIVQAETESESIWIGQAAPDSTDYADSPAPEGIGTTFGLFQKGDGAQIDTLDIGDERLQVVLCDDGTWHYIKNINSLSAMDIFKEKWNTETNAYGESLESLPPRVTICLVDTLSKWTCPNQTKVFSKFGYRRGRRHQGIDLPYPTGTPVPAAFDGRVRVSEYCSGYGNLVVIRHENGLETFYGHLSRRDVKPGDWVSSGDVIGLGGSTGRATGPHLHFEVRYQGFAFDPQWIADYETGKLHSSVFVLKRTYLDPSSHYVPQSIEEEEDVYGTDEDIAEEEARKAAELAAIRWHTVKSGETISSIAAKEHVSQAKIKSLNPGLNVNKISIGQKIRVN